MSDYSLYKVVNILSWNIFPIVCMRMREEKTLYWLQCEYVFFF